MANVLNHYQYKIISKAEYVKVLKQYTLQHYMGDHLNIAEDYDPDKGSAIVNINQRSEHYNHSEYTDLIITGLCGIRPAKNNKLIINPLIETSKSSEKPITYFCIENVLYHGHNITVLYDKSGVRYHRGSGFSIFVNGKLVSRSAILQKQEIEIPKPVVKQAEPLINLAVNISGRGFPKASASYTDSTDRVNMAIDGRLWYFNNVKNRWSCNGSNRKTDWYEVQFGEKKVIKQMSLFFYGNGYNLATPQNCKLVYWDKDQWVNVPLGTKRNINKFTVNTESKIRFEPIQTDRIRVVFTNGGKGKYTALSEIEIY